MNLPPDALVHCLGWTLVHFLWQGLCIAAWFKVCLWLFRRGSANQRYLAACVALAVMAVAPIITFNLLAREQAVPAPTTPVAVTLADPAANGISTAPPEAARVVPLRYELHSKIGGPHFDRTLPWLVVAWAVGVIALSIRLLAGWLQVEHLKRNASALIDEYWNKRIGQLARRLRMSRKIRLVQSALVEVPTVIGWLRPIILLPVACLAGLNTAQLESVLAHELAHIRRHDFLVNLLQNALETLLFYHPAVWWVSRCVRKEREHCCDDLALRVCGDRAAYARALATLEELRPNPGQLALAASGAPLLERIRRLAGRPDKEVGRSGWLAVAIFTMTIAVVVTLSFRENRAVAREQSQPANSATNTPNLVLAEWRTAALLSEAEHLFDAGDLDKAEAKFKQVPLDDPKAPRAALFLQKIKQAREANLKPASAKTDSEDQAPTPEQMYVRVFRVDTNFFEPLKGMETAPWLAGDLAGAEPRQSWEAPEIDPVDEFEDRVRSFFIAAGVDLNPDTPQNAGKLILYDHRSGSLLARSTTTDLDLIESALEALKRLVPAQGAEGKNTQAPGVSPADHASIDYLGLPGNRSLSADKIELQDAASVEYRWHAKANIANLISALRRLNTNTGTVTANGSADYKTNQLENEETRNGRVAHAQFSPDGKQISTTGPDGSLRVWDAQTGKPIGAISSNSAVSGLKTTASNEPARIWDARTGKAIEFAAVSDGLTNDSKEGRLMAPEMKASQAGKARATETPPLAVSIESDGNYRIGPEARPVTLEQLKSALVLEAQRNSQLKLLLTIDTKAPWDRVVKAMDAARDANIKNIVTSVRQVGNPYSITTGTNATETAPPMKTMTFHIDPNIFKEGLSSAASAPNRHGSESSGDQFVHVVATTNDAFLLRAHIESVLVTNGIDLDPANPLNAGKSFFYNDRKGTFFVHSTAAEIDRVETIIQALNTSPLEIRIKFVGASTNDSKEDRLFAPEVKSSTSPTNSLSVSKLETNATETPPPMTTRAFHIDPSTFQEGLKSAAASAPLSYGPKYTSGRIVYIVATNSDASVLRAQLENVLAAKGIDLDPANPLNAGKSFFYNDRKGTFMVHSTAAEIDRVKALIQSLNTSPPQIQIKAVFVEVDDVSNQFAGLSNFVKSGWSPEGQSSITNQPVSDTERFFQNREHPITNSILMQYTGTMSRAQAAEFMHKLEQQNGDILATPVVITKSGRQAQIQVSDVQSIVTGINPSGVGTNHFIVQSLPFGPTLDVIPRVSEDGRNIQMVVIPTVTEFIGYDNPGKFIANTNGTVRGGKDASLTAVLPLPHFRLRQLVANVSVEDGETIVLAGVAAESNTQLKDKVPVLGDIPLLGRLFRSSSTVKSRKNLLVFVTPTLVNPDGTPYNPGKATGEK